MPTSRAARRFTIRTKVASTVVGGVLALTAFAVPTATAQAADTAKPVAPAAGVVSQSDSAPSLGCTHTTRDKAWGWANLRKCGHGTKVHGLVRDRKNNNHCVFVRGHLTGGGVKDSQWACGKGVSRNVYLMAPRGKHFKWLELRQVHHRRG